MKLNELHFSNHALKRAVDMAIDDDQIHLCIEEPHLTFSSGNYSGLVYQHGDIAVAVSDDGCVTTILWSNDEAWQRDFDRTGDYEDRHRRLRRA